MKNRMYANHICVAFMLVFLVSCVDHFLVVSKFFIDANRADRAQVIGYLKDQLEEENYSCSLDRMEDFFNARSILECWNATTVRLEEDKDSFIVILETSHCDGFFCNGAPRAHIEMFHTLNEILQLYQITRRTLLVKGQEEIAIDADMQPIK